MYSNSPVFGDEDQIEGSTNEGSTNKGYASDDEAHYKNETTTKPDGTKVELEEIDGPPDFVLAMHKMNLDHKQAVAEAKKKEKEEEEEEEAEETTKKDQSSWAGAAQKIAEKGAEKFGDVLWKKLFG
jgi:hypothetical protein